MDIDGWAGRDRPSLSGGCTGGGIRVEPLREVPSCNSSLLNDDLPDAAVPGREAGCLVLEASSFVGGAGATGSAAVSIPSGPNGPMESSSCSSVADCARLPCRLGVRDLFGAGLAETERCVEVLGESGGDDVGSVCSISMPLPCYEVLLFYSIPEGRVASSFVAACAKFWFECDREGWSARRC